MKRFFTSVSGLVLLSKNAGKKIVSGGSTLKEHQMFSPHTTPEEFENATITGDFGFVVE